MQNRLSSSLLSKNIKNVPYRTLILPIVLYGCETWSLTLTEECGLRLFENRVRRRIYGPKRNKVIAEWRKLHNEELNDLYSSPMIIQVIKSKIMRWSGHVACMGVRTGAYRVLGGNLRETDHVEHPGVDVRIILRRNFKKLDGRAWTRLIWLRTGTGDGHL